MHPLSIAREKPGPFRLLCLGAHCDDIEIGCGATILRLVREIPDMEVRWVVFSGSERRHAEARRSADCFMKGLQRQALDLHAYRESFLPMQWGAIKEEFSRLRAGFDPTLIFTHAKHDAHQDHRMVAELTWATFRDHLILEYEIPKYECELTAPNLFFPVERDDADRKVNNLMRIYESQHGRGWFDEQTFLGMMRLRGVGCNATSGYAEAFLTRKAVL